MQLIPKNTPITAENAQHLLPLIETQSGYRTSLVLSDRKSFPWTYLVQKGDDGAPHPIGLRFTTREEAERSACRLLLGRGIQIGVTADGKPIYQCDIEKALEHQTAKLTAKVDRQCSKCDCEETRSAKHAELCAKYSIPMEGEG